MDNLSPSVYHVPPENASWSEIAIWACALGEAHGLISSRCQVLADSAVERFRTDGTLPASPESLSECLYYEQRRFHWLGIPPDEEHLTYILAEFSERLVAALYGGSVALDRTQKGWDVLAPDGDTVQRIQVKYLANPTGAWVNGHIVSTIPGVDRYDLVLFEDLRPLAVLSFRLDRLALVAAELNKRHAGTERSLQLTQRDQLRLLAEPAKIAHLGVRVTRLC